MKNESEGCTCMHCKKKYKIDIMIPDDIWAKITPSKVSYGGLLCGSCIMLKLEDVLSFDYFFLSKNFEIAKGKRK